MKYNYANNTLDDEEQWIEDHLEEFVLVDDGGVMKRSLMEAAKEMPIVHRIEQPVKGTSMQNAYNVIEWGHKGIRRSAE